MTEHHTNPVERRSFLTRLTSGLAAFGAAIAATPRQAAGQGAQSGRWQGTRHPVDDWMDQLPGQHRMFYDCTSPNGAGDGITFASNFFTGNKSGYGLSDGDSAIIICYRHGATPYAYSDAVWAKWGSVFYDRNKFPDPKTNAAPVINLYQSRDFGMQLPNRGTTIDALVKRGVHFAVCDMATHAFSGMIAGRMSLNADDVYQELVASAMTNAHFVPAGIVALNRAQERGYAVAHMG